jgi:hypothetical protein
MIKKWKDPEYRKNLLQNNPFFKHTKEKQSNAGKHSRIYENEVLENHKNEFTENFHPNAVCDRIAVKNGEIYFIEVKRKEGPGSELSEQQQKFRKIAKDKYLILRK